VTEGEPSDLLETGKLDREVESPAAGVAQTAGGPGDTYPVGTVISYIEPA
jgi:pyruvate/2-oxoglutarate dehydrogenase complex dihydrolipoamide acyltransferase (E2) component